MDAKFNNEPESKNYQAYLKLLMYISMPAQEDVWLAGYTAAQDNYSITDNPFEIPDEEYKIWENGWWDGFYGEDNIVSNLCDDKDKPAKSNKPGGL